MRTLEVTAVLGVLVGLVLAKPIEEGEILNLKMPGVQPHKAETYLCVPYKLGPDYTYITEFEPHANMSVAHHMLLFGCVEPAYNDRVWNCGEMTGSEQDPQYDVAPVCGEGPQHIIYAWGRDAPSLKLPKDVAFKVGGDTDIPWLVLQVHYKDVSAFETPLNVKDETGVGLHTSPVALPKTAGVYLLETGGQIEPNTTAYFETACEFTDPITIHPFAFRVHAHTRGKVVSGYRVRDGHWDEIGRMDPMKEQMFYNVDDPSMTVHPGDFLAARCTMVNNENRVIRIGSTGNDEMCNFYMMYWVDGDRLMDELFCHSAGPPHFYWNKMEEIQSENAPDSASVVPGTSEVIKATEEALDQAQEDMDNLDQTLEEELKDFLRMEGGRPRDDYPYAYGPRGGDYRYDDITEEDVEMDPRLWEEVFQRQYPGDYYDWLRQAEAEEEEEGPYSRLYDGQRIPIY